NTKLRLQEQALRDTAERKRLLEGYSGIAAIGQMTAGMIPLISHELGRIREELERLTPILAHRKIPDARESLTSIGESLDRMHGTLRMIATSAGGAERRRAIDLVAEARSYRRLNRPLLAARGVEMELIIEDDVLRTEMRPENFYCLLQILTTNSLEWMKA